MDPISIVGITIVLVGASLNVSEGLVKLMSHIKDTPNELLQASNVVTDFRLLLLNIGDSIRDEERLWRMVRSQSHPRLSLSDPSYNPAAAPEMQTLLRRAEARLNELQEVVRRFTELQNASAFGTFARIRMLGRRKLKILGDDLNSLKVSIASHFSVKGRYVVLFAKMSNT
jgi:hypothetical protein